MVPLLPLLFAVTVSSCGDFEAQQGEQCDQDGDDVPMPEGPFGEDGKTDALDRESVHKPLPPGATLDRDFQVFFAPDEPMMSVEMAMLQSVIDARKADTREFTVDNNPYRIRYAVYNLRARQVVDSLVQAHRAGVAVQVLVDARQMGDDYPWNTAYKYLERQGFEVYKSQKRLTDEQRRSANVVGIEIEGYMHLKTRLFEQPGQAALLTGSANPGENVAYSDDSLHVMREKSIVDAFSDCYNAILYGDRVANRWNEDSPVNALFSGNATGLSAGTQILRWIEQEDEQILLSVFSLRDFTARERSDSLVELIGKKVEQGVPVYVITDRKQSDGVDENGKRVNKDDPTEDRLRAVGAVVYETLNSASPYTAMHHKAAVLGRTNIRVISGSANWSFSGLGSNKAPAKNLESVLFLDTQALDGGFTGVRYLGAWVKILGTYAHQSEKIDGEPGFDEVFGRFVGMDNWPKQNVSFLINNANTNDWSVFVRGNIPELGTWMSLHNGLQLVTTEDKYPTWWSDNDISVLLGQSLEWRLWAGTADGESGIWETTKNRKNFAIPGPFDTAGKAVLQADWK